MEALRILVMADDPLVRTGLATLLAGQPDCRVVGQTTSHADLSAELAVARPDVVVWDWGWGPGAALGDLATWRADDPPVVVLLAAVEDAMDAWAAGARGLLPRDVSAERLVTALRAVADGWVVLDPEMAAHLLPAGHLPAAPLAEELTPREMEVLQLLAEGLPNKLIAQQLDISEHTVKFHVNAILRKLGVHSRTEAVVRATRLGLIIL